ncbi:MAG: glycine cleavage system protein T, partial [Gemmataceae bacterium]
MALRTPLHDWHLENGAVMVEFGGWDMPIRYGSISDEHLRVRKSCGMFDVSHMGRLSFSGKNSFDLIQKIWTNDAGTMKDLQVRYGLLCQDNGGILDDVLVYKWPYGWS